MQKYEIIEKLDELKDYEKIRIITVEGLSFDSNYADVVNNIAQECIIFDSLFPQEQKVFLYCSIKSILPA